MNSEKKRSSSGLIRRFLPYYKPYWRSMVFDLLCASVSALCELLLPLIVKDITARAGETPIDLTVKYVLFAAGLYLLLRVIDFLAFFYMSTYGHVMGTKIEKDMRRDFFAHLEKLSFSFYDNTKIGTLMSRLTSDLFDITEFAHHCPEELFIAGIKIVVSFVILARYSLLMTGILFAVLPLMVLVLFFFNSRMKSSRREERKVVGELNAQVQDSLLGVRVVQSFANEEEEKRKFELGNKEHSRVKKKAYMYMGGFMASTRLCEGIMYIVVIAVGAIFMIKEVIGVPEMIAYLLYVSTLLASVRQIVNFAEQFQRGLTGIERFTEIMDTEPDITDAPDARDPGQVSGKIEFRDVTFRYSEEGRTILDHLNLSIREGENVALVGPSGGGKTTVCNLIPRFYELTEGKILIDGQDVRTLTMAGLRRNIGIVQQDVYLFSGTVRENIEYGRPGASDEEIEEAARLAGADEFIATLPDGYDTYVGERGVKLSGGQKQRLSIARVFLKNPPILILDEATSALDNESERLVQQSLEKLAVGRTTLTIAHRLSTIKNADRILVMTRDGGLVEEGSHEELLQKGGTYAHLYNMSIK